MAQGFSFYFLLKTLIKKNKHFCIIRGKKKKSMRTRTYHWLQDVLHGLDELLVDLDGQVADHLPVLSQVEVGQAVFVLPQGVALHEFLKGKRREDVGGMKYHKSKDFHSLKFDFQPWTAWLSSCFSSLNNDDIL